MNHDLIGKNTLVVSLALLSIFLIGVCDSLSGPEISLSVFYVIPIAMTAYFVNYRTAIVLSVISTIVYLVADHFLSISYSRSAIPYWNAGVRLLFFLLLTYVLVKRKHAENQLSESEERFRLLVEGTRDCAIVMLDRDGKIINWNYGAERIFGFNSEQIKNRHCSCLYRLEDVQSGKPEQDLQHAGGEGKHIVEGWRLRNTGEEFWADVILTALRDSQGELRGYSLLTRDMSERRLAEQAVHLYAQLYEIDRAILAARSSHEIARKALDKLNELIPFQVASIYLLDSAAGKADLVAAAGEAEARASFLLDSLEFDNIERMKRSAPNIVEVTGIERTAWSDAFPSDVRSYVNVPLLSHNLLMGILNLGSGEKAAFSSEHIKTAEQVANQVALAINGARLLEEVQTAHDRLRLLSQKMIEVQETEKRHLARELHDEMGQALTALKIQLEEIQTARESAPFSNRLKECVSIVEKTVQQVRSLSLNLRPLVLDDLGLVAALRWYISRQSQLAGFQAHFSTVPEEIHLPPEIETACFRIAQEALTNVVRHAKAKSVNLQISESRGEIQLKIKDDGIGFDLTEVMERASHGENLGLLGMKERALLLGGEIDVESFPHAGTEIRVCFPTQSSQVVAQ